MTRLLTPFSFSRPQHKQSSPAEVLFSSMLNDLWQENAQPKGYFQTPKVDIWEEETAFKVQADLPGVREDDIDVKVHDGILTLSAESTHQTEEGEEGKTYYRRERSTFSFERHITLPEGIEESKVDAHLEKGVLTVTLPKSPEAKPKVHKINVRAK